MFSTSICMNENRNIYAYSSDFCVRKHRQIYGLHEIWNTFCVCVWVHVYECVRAWILMSFYLRVCKFAFMLSDFLVPPAYIFEYPCTHFCANIYLVCVCVCIHFRVTYYCVCIRGVASEYVYARRYELYLYIRMWAWHMLLCVFHCINVFLRMPFFIQWFQYFYMCICVWATH